jgi:hypothetical protein
VIGDGLIRLSLPLTHEIVAHIAGCSRPTATWALSRLTDLHLIQPENRGWLVQGSVQAFRRDRDGAAGPVAAGSSR